jgi:hypothetical protein
MPIECGSLQDAYDRFNRELFEASLTQVYDLDERVIVVAADVLRPN